MREISGGSFWCVRLQVSPELIARRNNFVISIKSEEVELRGNPTVPRWIVAGF
jgi:hypothetical protein